MIYLHSKKEAGFTFQAFFICLMAPYDKLEPFARLLSTRVCKYDLDFMSSQIGHFWCELNYPSLLIECHEGLKV